MTYQITNASEDDSPLSATTAEVLSKATWDLRATSMPRRSRELLRHRAGTWRPPRMCLSLPNGSTREHRAASPCGLAHWGLVPSWAKDVKSGNKLINAGSETILDSILSGQLPSDSGLSSRPTLGEMPNRPQGVRGQGPGLTRFASPGDQFCRLNGSGSKQGAGECTLGSPEEPNPIKLDRCGRP